MSIEFPDRKIFSIKGKLFKIPSSKCLKLLFDKYRMFNFSSPKNIFGSKISNILQLKSRFLSRFKFEKIFLSSNFIRLLLRFRFSKLARFEKILLSSDSMLFELRSKLTSCFKLENESNSITLMLFKLSRNICSNSLNNFFSIIFMLQFEMSISKRFGNRFPLNNLEIVLTLLRLTHNLWILSQ